MAQSSPIKIGFIGTGEITRAIVLGLNKASYPYEEILLSRRNADISARLARDCARIRVSDDNQEIADSVDLLFLAVRPQIAEDVLSQLQFRADLRIASLIATLTHDKLRQWVGPGPILTRSVPLPFVAEGRGVTAIYPANAEMEDLYGHLGAVVVARDVDELDALTIPSAAMGTYFGILQTLQQYLEQKGVSECNARTYIAGIFFGLANTAMEDDERSFAQLRVDHSTPGGLNQQMHEVFDGQGGSDALAKALDSVYARIRSAGKAD